MTEAKGLFSDEERHDSFSIQEGEETIGFTFTSCFDYDVGDWDVFSTSIPKNDFIEGAKQFLKTGSCKTDKLMIEVRGGDIHIFAGESFDVLTSHLGFMEWDIRCPIRIEQFKEMLRGIIEQNESEEEIQT